MACSPWMPTASATPTSNSGWVTRSTKARYTNWFWFAPVWKYVHLLTIFYYLKLLIFRVYNILCSDIKKWNTWVSFCCLLRQFQKHWTPSGESSLISTCMMSREDLWTLQSGTKMLARGMISWEGTVIYIYKMTHIFDFRSLMRPARFYRKWLHYASISYNRSPKLPCL